MTRLQPLYALAFLCTLASSAWAAEALPPTAKDKPVTEVRVGGSPADASFRNAMQKSGEDFRAARKTCVAGAKADRAECLRTARAKLNEDRSAAKAAHQIAK